MSSFKDTKTELNKSISLSKPIIGNEEIEAVVSTLKSWIIVQWPQVLKLEENFCNLTRCKYAVAMNSWTAVIHWALYWLWIGPWDEVITPPFTFVASANPILMVWAKVVFADIEENTFLLDPVEVEKKITPRTKAILSVSLYWHPHHYLELKKIADKYNLKLIEDASQSIWASLWDMQSWSLWDAGTFSLYATKNIHCAEGWVLVTNNEEVYERAKMLRHHGQSEKTRYEYFDIWYNYRLTDIHASIANVQFSKIEYVSNKRRELAWLYNSELSWIKWLQIPILKNEDISHVYHQYTIKINEFCKINRDELMSSLKKKEIWCWVYYPKPLHLHPHFARLWYKDWDFPISESVSKQVLSLPVHPSLKNEDIILICNFIKECLQN